MRNIITPEEWLSKPRIMAGLMTGTSIDGIDVSIVEFHKESDSNLLFRLIDSESYPYTKDLKQLIISVLNDKITIREVTHLNYSLAEAYAHAVQSICDKAGIIHLDAVSVHGQTMWHEPGSNGSITKTLQLGAVSALANFLETTVVGNFREADTALGGQGAPLVPIFDFDYISKKDENIIALNIGGISNITLMPAGCTHYDIHAFDTGPGNMLIDLAMKALYLRGYDEDGNVATSGKLIPELLNELKSIPFITDHPPKSTGRELFGTNLIHHILDRYAHGHFAKDVITTLSYFTAWSIAENIRLFGEPNSTIIFSGGGSHNKYIFNKLQEELPDSKVIKSDEIGIPSDFKEAICFAYLGYRTLSGLPSNIISVTGATKEKMLGVIAYG
jgi:anhydro-N-acetylmuramic acid kinase